jgi:anthranilate synthase/aminodeoxychorismate synthase-like glutamine amidotransferase
MKILVIDNIDSFVYNLVQYLGEEGVEPIVVNNRTSLDEIDRIIEGEKVDKILISPGPKRPEEAGVSNEVIKKYGPKIPILGVCLGHQCIGYVYGGKIRRARTLMHGKTSKVTYTTGKLLQDLSNPFDAVRYHSLVIDDETIPDSLAVCARSEDDKEIMAIEHKDFPVYGIQFHPESIKTDEGRKIIKNFLAL